MRTPSLLSRTREPARSTNSTPKVANKDTNSAQQMSGGGEAKIRFSVRLCQFQDFILYYRKNL